MNDTIRKALNEGTVPIMSDEGMLEVFRFYYNRCLNNLPISFGKNYHGGPSRNIILSVSKSRIDDLDFDKEIIESYTDNEFRRLYGTSYSGDISDDFPFGRFKNASSGAEYDTRIYINAPYGKVRYDFMILYATKCKERGIPCGAKFLEKNAESSLIDNMILYSSHENLNTNLEILEEIKNELPKFAECCGSPISSGLNYSYYAICHYGDSISTYNYWFNNLSSRAFCITLSQLIRDDTSFYSSLTEKEKNIIDIISNIELSLSAIKQSEVKDNTTVMPRELQGIELDVNGVQIAKNIFNRFVSSSPKLLKRDVINNLRENIQTIASLSNFGDMEHKDFPISIRESNYLAVGMSPRPINAKVEETKPSKKIYSKEKVEDIFNADERQIRIEALKVGYTFADINGKSEQEMRAMIFDKITLDNASMITILCGGDYQLKAALVGYGTASKEIAEKSREELERMYIEKVGLDEIITAREEVKKRERTTGEKRTHWYENSLQAMRMERGKSIIESETFKSLETEDERRTFFDGLSQTELEDVERYYEISKNLDEIVDQTTYAM